VFAWQRFAPIHVQNAINHHSCKASNNSCLRNCLHKEQTMNKKIVRIMSVLLTVSLTIGSFTPGQAKTQPASVMSERLINLAHFYKPPSNSDAPTLASRFGFVLLTGGDEVFRDKVIANGFSSTIPQYFMFLGIQDPGSCTGSTRNNQAAYNSGDFCSISQNHPDWFLLDTNGQRIRMEPGSDVYRMDPGNAEWRNFFLTRLLEWQSRTGWSGLFLDCLESSLGELERNGTVPAKYPDDASYRAAILGFLEFLDVNYSQPYGRPILANITMGLDESTWSSYMQYLDGAMQERWAVDWDVNKYVKESKWQDDLARAEKFQSQGKYMILVAPGNKADANRQNFAFASYLLISNGKAAFRYSNSDVYREVWMYNNYQVDLGAPLGPRFRSGNLWKREFTKGFVTVDPVNHTATISTNTQPASTPTTAASPTPVMPTITHTVVAPTATLVQPTSTTIPPTPIPVQPTATVLPTTTAAAQPTNNANSSTDTFYDDKNPLFVYSTGWQNVSTSNAYSGSYKETTRNGVTVKFPFTGQSFSVLYKGGPYFNVIDVYVDGALVGTINQKLSAAAFQQRWDYPGTLTAGRHTLKLVFKAASGGMSRGSVDAVIVR
jgi:hypothetical protein